MFGRERFEPRMRDITHHPDARSWVASANAADSDFPIQNLPFGRFRHNPLEPWQIGVAIGDRVLDLYAIGLIDHNDMRRLMDAPADARRELRLALWQGLSEGSSLEKMWADALLRQTEVELGVPCEVSAFTRFEDSSPWAPMASAGRASSVAASGQQFHRPHGLLLAQGPEPAREASADPVISPQLGVTRQLVFEEGLAAWARAGVAQGAPVSIAEAESCIAGLTLINDWCARDLGPSALDARSFATTTSPWLVTPEALAPFRAPHDRAAPAHLDCATNRTRGGLLVHIEVWLQTAARGAAGQPAVRLAQSDTARLGWTLAQLVAQHTLGGCSLRTGDVLGTAGLNPGAGKGGLVQDGDTIILRGACVAAGARRIGFGECRSTVLAAVKRQGA